MPNDPSSSVSVSGITDAQLAALQQAGLLAGQSGLGVQTPSVDEMRYETQVAPAYNPDATPAPSPSVLDSLPSMDEISNYLTNLPTQAQRLLTNPAAFTEMLTGKNPLPEQTGFAASATGLPAQNPNSLFTPEGMAYNRGYESGEPVSIAAMGVPALAPAGRMLGSAAGERILAGKSLVPGVPADLVNPQIMSAVKDKGGNWLTKGVEQLDWMKKPINNVGSSQFDTAWDNANPQKIAHHISEMEKIGYAPEQIQEFKDKLAVNNWIDSKLKKYVKNEMGTPQDPVRELADQGILHLPQEEIPTSRGIIQQNRAEAGFPEKGFATTPLGQQWERATDYSINSRPAAAYQEHGKLEHRAKQDPWVNKLERSTPVNTATLIENGLGFEHLTDELNNAISHNSDLPAHLRIKPETLDKMTVPHAVKHVAKINKYRAEQAANAAKQHLKEFPVVHADENGFNIHELKTPELGSEFKFEKIEGNKHGYWKVTDPNGQVHSATGTTEADARRQFNNSKQGNYEKLDKALKNEGAQMGHCVGGYTDSVARGDSRIFSLRDEKGGAHATVEATPKILDYNPRYIPQEVQDEIAKYAHSETIKAGYPENSQGYWNHHTGVEIQEGTKYLKNHPVMDIKQIKGKGNGEVSDKYRNYIKNWLNKESDKIHYVNDLHNVGLHDLKNGLVRQENLDKRLAEGFKSGQLKRFSTDEEVRDFMNKPAAPMALTPAQMREELFAKSRADEAARRANEPRTLQQRMRDQGLLPPEGYAKGGSVQFKDPDALSYDPSYYQEAADSVNPEGQSGGYNDAARHIIAAADLTRRISDIPVIGKYIADPAVNALGHAHEFYNTLMGGQTVEDKAQDLHNNEVGRKLGAQATSFQDIVNRTPELLDVRPYQMEDNKAMVRNPAEAKTPYKFFKNGGSVQYMNEGGTPDFEGSYLIHPDVQRLIANGEIDPGDVRWMSDYAFTKGDSVKDGTGAWKDQSEKMQNHVGRMERGEIPIPKHMQGPEGVRFGGNSSGLNPNGAGGIGGGGGRADVPISSPKSGGGGGAGYVPGTTNPFNPDSPLNRKNGGKIPSIDEMRLTILRNK